MSNADDPDEFDPLMAEIASNIESSTPPPREKLQISEMRHWHEQVINWLITNPHRSQKECAYYFSVSQAWLSIIIHSDAFQARLKERQDQLFGLLTCGITEKMTVLADVGLSKLVDKMETSDSEQFIKQTTEMALKGLGFGQAARGPTTAVNAQNVQQNFYVASREDLVAARERWSGMAPSTDGPIVEATPSTESAPALPASNCEPPPDKEPS